MTLVQHHTELFIRIILFLATLNLRYTEMKEEKAWKQEIKVVNQIFYCYVLPITTNSISSVHFHLHKYKEKQTEQSDSHDSLMLQSTDSTMVS